MDQCLEPLFCYSALLRLVIVFLSYLDSDAHCIWLLQKQILHTDWLSLSGLLSRTSLILIDLAAFASASTDSENI